MSSALVRAGQMEGEWEERLGAEEVAVAEWAGKLLILRRLIKKAFQ